MAAPNAGVAGRSPGVVARWSVRWFGLGQGLQRQAVAEIFGLFQCYGDGVVPLKHKSAPNVAVERAASDRVQQAQPLLLKVFR